MDHRNSAPETKDKSSPSDSVTECINEAFENSELEVSKVVSIQVKDDVQYLKNPLSDLPNSVGSNSMEKSTDSGMSSFNIRKMYIAAGAVLLFPVLMGMTGTYSGTATMDMKKPHSSIHPNDDQVTWIGSLMAIGALVGGSVGGVLANLFGRKGALILNTAPFVLGWLLIAYAQSISMIYAGRIITGFSTGIVSAATPMYLVEISTPEVRGLLGSCFQLFAVIGVLFISFLGSVLSWGNMALGGGITSLVAGFVMIFMPESPRWLVSKQKREQAIKAITFLQGKEFDAVAEIVIMENDIKSQPEGRIDLQELKTPVAYKPFIFSILLMFFQQFSGVNAVLFYSAQIFVNAGSSMDPITATIIVAAIQVIATLLASVLMDKLGRKILLLASSSLMALSLLVFGGFDFAKVRDPQVVQTLGWLPLVCLMGFIAAFSIGFGPAPWLMVAEMTSARFKSIISGVATALNWFFVFVVTKSYLAEEKAMHAYGVYWMYAGFCILAFVFVYFLLPETKGKTLDEVQQVFLGRRRSRGASLRG